MHSFPILFVPLFLSNIPQDAAQPGLSNDVLIVKKKSELNWCKRGNTQGGGTN